ncbi:hypothetical protein HQ545_01450 [Candidatus Woesearchaeota archaeon]|nr:hypothetical protein [Candidatus Woesearchaeota archaeon]
MKQVSKLLKYTFHIVLAINIVYVFLLFYIFDIWSRLGYAHIRHDALIAIILILSPSILSGLSILLTNNVAGIRKKVGSFRMAFYALTSASILVTLFAIFVNYHVFRWWFFGLGSNIFTAIFGAYIYFVPLLALILSFFVKKRWFYSVFIINYGISLPVQIIASILPYT